jgi:hypothetical protein
MKTSDIVIKSTYPILLLALLAAGAGIFWQRPGSPSEITTLRGETFELFGRGLYHYDTVSYAAQAIGQDAATLLVGIPLLFTGLLLARKGSLRGELLLAGGLGYMLYTYTSYSFLSAYNEFFLVYVALFSLSLFAFILALTGMDTERVARSVSGGMPRQAIALFLLFIAAFLSLAWLGRILPPLLAGTPPPGLEAYTTLVIQALDLGIIVPVSVITAVLLWQKKPWGYTLASVLLVKALMMGAALIAMIIGQALAGVELGIVESVIFAGISLAAITFTVLLFRNIEA